MRRADTRAARARVEGAFAWGGALLAALALAAIINLQGGTAYAFTLSDAEDADNHGFTCRIEESTGTLFVQTEATAAYNATFQGDPDTELVIPETWNGVTVKSVLGEYFNGGNPMTKQNNTITRLVLPDTFEFFSYDRSPMTGGIRLVHMQKLNKVTEIVFAGDPVNLTSLGEGDKAGSSISNRPLAKFNAGTVTTSEGERDFDIVIPDTITRLPDKAFSSTTAESVYIPSSITDKGSDPFSGAANLKYVYNASNLEFTFPEGVEVVNESELTSYGNNRFEGSDFETYTVPANITSIGDECFKDCKNLKEIVFEGDIESIGRNAFQGCTALERVVFKGEANGVTGFSGCTSLKEVVFEKHVAQMTGFSDCTSLTDVTFEQGVEQVGGFAGCTSLESIDLGSDVTSIDNYAFQGCTNLNELIIDGENLITIGNYAFEGVPMKTLTLPDSVEDIGYGAFFDTGIEAFVVPADLWKDHNYSASSGTGQDFITATDQFTFGGGSTAKSAALFVNKPHYDMYKTENWNTTLKSVDLSKYSQWFLPHYMFSGCAGLTEVEIPASVENLGFGVFGDCVKLEDVYFYNLNGATIAETESGTGSTGAGGGQEGWLMVYPGSFSQHLNKGDVEGDENIQKYSDLDSLTIYGASTATSLIDYVAKHPNYTFVPFAFLGDGGSSEDAVAKFGTTLPANGISIASFTAGGSPSIEIIYPYDEGVSRTLVPGEDCTVVYTDANGNEVTSFDKAGTYIATITGDNKSVWGTTTAQFTVAAAPTVDVPVADSGNTGITAEGSLVVPDGSETILEVAPVTEGEAYDALIAKLGDDMLAGMFEAKLLVDGQEVDDGFGSITLTFPLDAKWNGHYVTVYHRHDDGTITSERVVAADGKVSVTVTDLSTFMLAASDVQAVTPPTQTDQTQPIQQASGQGDGSALNSLADTGDSVPVIPIAAAAGAAVVVAGAAAFAQSRRQ